MNPRRFGLPESKPTVYNAVDSDVPARNCEQRAMVRERYRIGEAPPCSCSRAGLRARGAGAAIEPRASAKRPPMIAGRGRHAPLRELASAMASASA
jgi:hypothetical protein